MAKGKHDIITSPRLVELRRENKLRRYRLTFLLLVLFVIIIAGLSYLSNYHKIVINKVEVTGTYILDNKSIESKVQEDLQGKYLYLFAKKNTFIYPKSFIEHDLQKTFPRIENLSVKLEGVNTLKVTIGERVGSYLYCGASIPGEVMDIGENCYFINYDGYIFDTAPYFSGNIYFKFYIPIDDSKETLGQNVLDKEKFHQIIAFIDRLEELGFNPVSLDMSNEENFSFKLKARPDGGEPQILFKKENDLPNILNNLVSAMKKKEFKDTITSNINKLQYIDLRFNNKVLYKFNE
jgi:hypothetical protein